jgi:low affinity Fe/Cu permease
MGLIMLTIISITFLIIFVTISVVNLFKESDKNKILQHTTVAFTTLILITTTLDNQYTQQKLDIVIEQTTQCKE